MKKRILIFSIAYEPLIGGAELAVRKITDRLSSYPPSHEATADIVSLTEKKADPSEALAKEGGYDFDLITCRLRSSLPREEKIGNVRVFRVGFGSRLGRLLYPALAFRFAKKLRKIHRYQLVWGVMAAYASAAALMFLRRFPDVKFLLTLQEGDSIEHIHRRVRGFTRRWKRVFKRADRIQAISSFLASWARKEGATCPIDVVPNGVDLERFKILDLRFKNQNQKIIITVSRLEPKNGVDTLIRAAKALGAMVPDLKFIILILGSGSEERRLKKLAQELKVSDVVQFKGEIPPDEVPKYLSQADIFVRPSRSEGLGSAFLEAMALGLPVIGTPVGGIPDFLQDKQTGLFCKVDNPLELAEKIQLLLTDEGLRQKIALQGQKLVLEKYSWEKIAEQMDQIFQKLLG